MMQETTERPLVVVLMGSPGDWAHIRPAVERLLRWGVTCAVHVASAHKTPERLLELLRNYEADPRPKVYLTVAGRSNALSGMADAAVLAPVIACPPPSEAFAGADLFSSLRMPSGVAPLVVLDPGNAALAALKMLALAVPALRDLVAAEQEQQRQRLHQADAEIQQHLAEVHRELDRA